VNASHEPLAATVRGHDVLEQALVACLAALADVASTSGQEERALRLREAIDVLAEDQLTAAARLLPTSPRAARCPLTPRELEVLELIAQGLTNRQVAEQLVISERTADTHVQNILGKLRLTCRAQAAIWFVEQARRSNTN
jgi:DNA-binding NarL/FixJ family response regulator